MTPVRGVSDLQVTATAQPAAVYVGQNVTYTVTVSNNGLDDEPDAILACPLPPDVVVVSASSSQGQTPSLAHGQLTADLGLLAAGQTARVTLVVMPQAAAAGTLTTSFSVNGENFDPMPSNNDAQMSVHGHSRGRAGGHDLSRRGSRHATRRIGRIPFMVAISGLSDATGVIVSIPLPPDVQLVSATSSQGPAPDRSGGYALGRLWGRSARDRRRPSRSS